MAACRRRFIFLPALLQLAAQHRGYRVLICDHVVSFCRIILRAVEFRPRRLDVVVVAGFQAVQRAPAKGRERIESFAVGGGREVRAIGGEQTGRVELLLNGIADAGHLQHGGRNGNTLYGRGNGAQAVARWSGGLDDQRHAYGGVVDKKTVLLLAVFAQGFAVVAEQHNPGVRIKPRTLQPFDEPRQLAVSIGNLAVVRVLSVLAEEGLGRVIRTMRIVEMEPEEEGPRAMLPQPREGRIHAGSGTALHQFRILFQQALRVELVVVVIKAAVQAPAAVEHKGADDGAGGVAMVVKRFG